MPASSIKLRTVPLRTLAWLGDAEYERVIRWRIAETGPWKSAELERVRVYLARAETQAEFLQTIQEKLDPAESELIRRTKNISLPSPRGAKSVKTYRMATALEALISYWTFEEIQPNNRFTELLSPLIDAAIAKAFDRTSI